MNIDRFLYLNLRFLKGKSTGEVVTDSCDLQVAVLQSNHNVLILSSNIIVDRVLPTISHMARDGH